MTFRAQSPDLSIDHPPPTSSKAARAIINKKTPSLSELNRSAIENFNEKNKNLVQKSGSVIDSDLAFLQNVLPDIKLMSNRQKRLFKIGILQLVAETSTPASVSRTIDSVQDPHNTSAKNIHIGQSSIYGFISQAKK